MLDPELVKAWYDRLPVHQRDQFDTYLREAMRLVRKVARLVEEYEQRGSDAAERYANGERATHRPEAGTGEEVSG